jgi:hypothetical protein
MYIYMYIYMNIYIYTYVYIYLHMYMYMHILIYPHIYYTPAIEDCGVSVITVHGRTIKSNKLLVYLYTEYALIGIYFNI